MVHKRNDGKDEEKDEARTPLAVFWYLNGRYRFDVDIATNGEHNSLCKKFFMKSEEHPDGFLDEDVHLDTEDRAYGNPPYSRGNIDRFIEKAWLESLEGALVVLLLPMDSSTKVFHKYCMKACNWIIFQPRIHFLRPDGSGVFEGSPKFGSFACVFDYEGRKGCNLLVESVDLRKLPGITATFGEDASKRIVESFCGKSP